MKNGNTLKQTKTNLCKHIYLNGVVCNLSNCGGHCQHIYLNGVVCNLSNCDINHVNNDSPMLSPQSSKSLQPSQLLQSVPIIPLERTASIYNADHSDECLIQCTRHNWCQNCTDGYRDDIIHDSCPYCEHYQK